MHKNLIGQTNLLIFTKNMETFITIVTYIVIGIWTIFALTLVVALFFCNSLIQFILCAAGILCCILNMRFCWNYYKNDISY